jgi:hypothetical protein
VVSGNDRGEDDDDNGYADEADDDDDDHDGDDDGPRLPQLPHTDIRQVYLPQQHPTAGPVPPTSSLLQFLPQCTGRAFTKNGRDELMWRRSRDVLASFRKEHVPWKLTTTKPR